MDNQEKDIEQLVEEAMREAEAEKQQEEAAPEESVEKGSCAGCCSAAEDADEAEDMIIGLQRQLENEKNFSLRLQADFDNFKKRNQKISQEMYQEGVADTAAKFLPVLDNFDRALESCAQEGERQGIELIRKQILEILEKMGVEEIEAEGAAFDPNYHNAVLQVEDAEKQGMVVAVMQKGYRLKDKILRYAMVQVGI